MSLEMLVMGGAFVLGTSMKHREHGKCVNQKTTDRIGGI
jgi:hypothetical protein